MKATLVSQNGGAKRYKLEHEGKSAVLDLNYVKTRKKVQARRLFCNEEEIARWRPHGSFKQLIKTRLGYAIDGTRQHFIDKIYQIQN